MDSFSGVFPFFSDLIHDEHMGSTFSGRALPKPFLTETILTLVDLEHGLCMPWQDLDMGYDIDDMDVR